ncbi:SMEK domain-containing protein [Aliarcobacter butzleri]|uniref:SMEK domain-containing protein n=1 Tax=Aliarcobacter butzleri TaxID=28197 RepID=UPI0021B4DA09|nr:SMEK domain-containing protein [Aliarcobacter butzleri]MCT7649255.1 SMEK domain-containing protein [Aliarcobacter butzleri]
MVETREDIFNKISKSLAITKYDIEHRQSVNDYALNIHSENFFRDILNFIYGYELVNSNKEKQNTAYVDLVDNKRELFFQVTTTRTKEKIENTLQILNEEKYKEYKIKILYLLEKSKPNQETINELNSKYNIKLLDCLLDSNDLIREINDLETTKLKDLYLKYFKDIQNKYSEVEILDLVIKHLISSKKKFKINYGNNDFGSIESNEKLKLNNINQRISSEINSGLDYRVLIEKLEEDNTITDLKALIVEDKYKSILERKLLTKVKKEEIVNKNVSELHILSKLHNLNFNEIINELYENIKSEVEIDDFNSLNVTWIIIAFFFEICDIGVKE